MLQRRALVLQLLRLCISDALRLQQLHNACHTGDARAVKLNIGTKIEPTLPRSRAAPCSAAAALRLQQLAPQQRHVPRCTRASALGDCAKRGRTWLAPQTSDASRALLAVESAAPLAWLVPDGRESALRARFDHRRRTCSAAQRSCSSTCASKVSALQFKLYYTPTNTADRTSLCDHLLTRCLPILVLQLAQCLSASGSVRPRLTQRCGAPSDGCIV
jgi:hypothetical protein